MKALALVFLTLGAQAQEAYFKEPERHPGLPGWELEVRQDRVELGQGRPDITRAFGRLRLRWDLGEEDDPVRLRVQSAHRIGSDGNVSNAARFDNERSNGSSLDLLELRLRWLRASGGLELRGGLVENGLIATEALWDPDLRVIGGTARAFWRSESVEELGLRVQAGDAQALGGGHVHLRGVQGVLRTSVDAFSVTLFGGPWSFSADPRDLARFTRQYPTGYAEYPLQDVRLTTYGLEAAWTLAFPLEIKAHRNENRDSHERGEEFQAWAGPRHRPWWPRFGYIRQRLDPDGEMPAVNGDSWWFRTNADGQRYSAALALPQKWALGLNYVEQTRRGTTIPVKRTFLSLTKRF